ncbi:MAG: AGE family epimerase/isomerase [Lachnospiraceae bacterium]|nr:AGE family epimerase/isomerase [Lachnospiraceae bacterium]
MDAKYRIDTEANRQFLHEISESLLAFGRRFPAPDGSSYYLGDDGTPWKDRNRETWITSRMVHVYSIGTMLGDPGSEELMQAGMKGLTGALHDQKNGGWYAGLTPEGGILPTKQCYAHAFVILAASSALLAGCPGAKELLDEALALYDLRFWNEEEGLSCDTWNTEFTELSDYRGLNANMHTVEAFLAAADALGDETYRVRAGRIIGHVLGWAEGNGWRTPEHYTKEWKSDLTCNIEKPDDPFKPYGATPGHGIEWARLVTQWALSSFTGTVDVNAADDRSRLSAESKASADDRRLLPAESKASADDQRFLSAAESLYDRAIRDAWNADGAPGICYTTDWNGTPVVHDRMHWTLAEAINTSAVLYHVTGKERYAEDYSAFMRYLDEYVLDHENGSWYHQLDRQNQVIGTVWPGKSDLYHALQATLIPYEKPEMSIAAAIHEKNMR